MGFLGDVASFLTDGANWTGDEGIPTIDGLGPVGGDDHSADEWLDLASVIPRTTLLAALIDGVAEAI